MLFLTIEFGFVFYIFSLVINNLTVLRSFGFSEKSNFASLVIFLKFYEILIFLTGKMQTAFIRKMEFRADQYAVTRFNKDNDVKHGLQHALIKAFKKNMKEEDAPADASMAEANKTTGTISGPGATTGANATSQTTSRPAA